MKAPLGNRVTNLLLELCGGKGDRAHSAGVPIHHNDSQRPGVLYLGNGLLERKALREQLLVGCGQQRETEALAGDVCVYFLSVSLDQEDIQLIYQAIMILLQREVAGRNA